ncbi:hypothetical protein MPSEU_000029700 [Mayamaea pseudoterrestris]|nr:hypothetical protein MPSEU_000029700 [Mayamaea pseudoterrestris]
MLGYNARGGRGRGLGRGRGRNTRPVDIVEQTERSMKEWGVQPNRNEQHRKFWDDYLTLAREISRGKVEAQEANVLEILPNELVKASLMGNLNKNASGFLVVTDRLADVYPDIPVKLPPFAFDTFQRDYCLRTVYEDLEVDLVDVDPLTRFESFKEPVMQGLRRQYVDEDGDPWSVVARALVAQEACHGAKCVHCGAESLHWNGYTKDTEYRYWKKMVCKSCGSVYEIKTAKTLSAVETRFEKFIMNANFLDAYHAVQTELRNGAKQYVALLCEEREFYEGVECWPVYYAAVKQVYPQLKAASFCPSDHAKIYSKFTVETPNDISHHLWFHVPVIDNVDWKEIAEGVIDSLEEKAEAAKSEDSKHEE